MSHCRVSVAPVTTLAPFAPDSADALLRVMSGQFILSITDVDGTIVDVNEGFCAVSGYRRDELLGARHSIVNSGHHPAPFFADLWRRLRAGEAWRGDLANRAKDGSDFWLDAVIAPLASRDGGIDRFVMISSDITARKLAQAAALRDEGLAVQRRLEAIPIAWQAVDANSHLLNVSDHWLAQLGFQRDEVIGRVSRDFFTSDSAIYAKNYVFPHFLRYGHIDDVELQMVRKDGQVIDVMLSAVLERDAAGQPLRSSTVIVDITARKQAERKLAASEALYKTLVDEHTDFIALSDHDGVLIYVNHAYAARLGRSAAELVGRSLFDHVPDGDRDQVREHLRVVRTTGVTREEESLSFAADGSPRWIAWIDRAVMDAQGRVTGIHSVGRDITERKRIATELERRNRSFAMAADAAGMGFWEWDIQANAMRWDDWMYRLYGHARSEGLLPHEVWSNSLHPDDRQSILELERRAFEGTCPFDTEFRVIHRDGSIRHIKAAATIVRDAGGRPSHMYGVNVDVTARRRVEAELENRNRIFAIAADAGGMGFWDWDTQSNVLTWDDWMFRLYGRTRTEGLLPYEVWENSLHPDDRERSVREIRVAEAGAQPFDTEFRIVHPDGSIRHIKAAASIVRDGQGRTAHMFGFNLDVTERRRIEAELHATNQRFAIAAHAAGIGFWDWDLKSGQVFWDDLMFRLFGCERTEDFDARSLLAQRLHPEDKLSNESSVRAALASKATTHDVEFRVIVPDGTVRYMKGAASIVRDARGRAVHMAGMVLDISERKQVELQLAALVSELTRANAEMEKFVYIASHDLRSPLRGIRLLADWIAEDLSGSLLESTRTNLALMQGRLMRMEMLLSDLLTYARAGKGRDELAVVDVGRMVADIFDLTATTTQIRLQAGADLTVIRTFKVPLELVFRNLIGNAIKHHDKPCGTITVTARAIDGGFEFSVSDDGPGIPPDQHQRVFDMFQTLRPRDEVEGSGIGLAIIKKTVEAVNGTVSLESDGVHGCTFRFTWPGEAVAAPAGR